MDNPTYSENGISILGTVNGLSVSIPVDPANSDYQEILRQVEEEGLVIAEYTP